jgi:phage protein D
MPEANALTSQIIIKLEGTQVQEPVMAKLTSAVIDQNVHMPGMFILRFNDSDLELLNSGPFDLTKEVEIAAETGEGERVTIFKGEVTAIEPEFEEGMICTLVVRGFDKSHRLYRETHSKAFLNTKDSDIAHSFADTAGLQAEVETTTTVYEHIYQHNQTDLEFLLERAWRIGFECFVSEGKLYFRKPPTRGEGPTLTWGQDLLQFHPKMTLAEQVDEVVVKGWDPEQQQAIVGRASAGELYPQNGEQRDGAAWASSFGAGKLVIVDQPVVSQAEANLLAEARLNELSGAFIQAEGVAFRRPDVQAGRKVKLEALGSRFSGTYLVTGATHNYAASGLKTIFTVRGLRTGLLAESLDRSAPDERIPGVVLGVVTDTSDPLKIGRVKVKFPWMTEDANSQWARVVGAGAGPEAGFFAIPEVNDEVLVAFEFGNFNRPIILGGLWNSRDSIPPEASAEPASDHPKVRTWRSIGGHRVTLLDTSDKQIEIVTSDGRSITLSDGDRKIILKTSSASIEMEDTKITIKAQTDVIVEASANLKLKGSAGVDIEAGGVVNIKGATINLNS